LNLHLILLFLVSFGLTAQESITLDNSILPNTRGFEKNPISLVNKLTEGLSSEKEKFDVIFTWVVKNIRYDYSSYLSVKGNKSKTVKNVLRKKKALCLDYALLMDTLCELAGVQNITVVGYVKDDLFDVNDSIFIDNHAWNAVRLNQRWYVYDITWSSGSYVPEWTRLSEFFIRLKEKVGDKTKTKKRKFKRRVRSECVESTIKYTVEYQKRTFWNNLLIRILDMKKLRYRLVFDKVTNLNYYLVEPDVFSITHFPDNPYWSLTSKIKTIQDFEGDSAYYFLNKTVYENQERAGKICFDCDKYPSLNQLEKAQQIKENSAAFNERNKFVSFSSNFEIAEFYFNKSKLENDSLMKVSLLDSTIHYLKQGRGNLRQCSSSIRSFSKFHKSKNKHKKHLAHVENKKHLRKVNALFVSISRKYRNMRLIKNKQNQLIRNYKNQSLKMKRIKVAAVKSKISPDEKIVEIQNLLSHSMRQVDSIDLMITDLSNQYSSVLVVLSENVWKGLNLDANLIYHFHYLSFVREFYLLDNYKRKLKEIDESLNDVESDFMELIQNDILALADSTWQLNAKITQLVKLRNKNLFNSAKLINQLVKENVVTSDSLRNFCENQSLVIELSKCRIIDNSPVLESVNSGFKTFHKRKKTIVKYVVKERKSEDYRFRVIDKEINRRVKKYTNSVRNNYKVTNNRLKLVMKNKKDYLAKLKLEKKME
jgi:hypothetical protein